LYGLGQMQSEQGRLAGQQAELQRRLGEAELRADLNCKAAEQEASSVRVEAEFLRRKVDLLSKEAGCHLVKKKEPCDTQMMKTVACYQQ
jgi:hypothetical protein